MSWWAKNKINKTWRWWCYLMLDPDVISFMNLKQWFVLTLSTKSPLTLSGFVSYRAQIPHHHCRWPIPPHRPLVHHLAIYNSLQFFAYPSQHAVCSNRMNNSRSCTHSGRRRSRNTVCLPFDCNSQRIRYAQWVMRYRSVERWLQVTTEWKNAWLIQ